MKPSFTWNGIAKWIAVLASAFALKHYYASATADQLRWILAPTTACVEIVTGSSFEFESGAGYISEDRSFLIASSCAGVNFLITGFLMLSLRKLLRDRSKTIGWRFIPIAAVNAYVVTLVANTARIAIALRTEWTEAGWLNPSQLHRFEGIFIYFAFLLLLFVVSESIRPEKTFDLFQKSFFPLLVYYATTLGVPLANGAYHRGTDFWEHSLFVLLIPLVMILPIAVFQFCRSRFVRSETIHPRAWRLEEKRLRGVARR